MHIELNELQYRVLQRALDWRIEELGAVKRKLIAARMFAFSSTDIGDRDILRSIEIEIKDLETIRRQMEDSWK